MILAKERALLAMLNMGLEGVTRLVRAGAGPTSLGRFDHDHPASPWVILLVVSSIALEFPPPLVDLDIEVFRDGA